jgi:hypothetical protein
VPCIAETVSNCVQRADCVCARAFARCDTFGQLRRGCVFVGSLLLCGFFFVQKLCADRFRSQKRRVIEFVFYREIVQSKVEVQTQYMSGRDRCSFQDSFKILFRRLVTVLNTFVRTFCFLVYCVPGVGTFCDPCPLFLCV